MTLRSLLSQAVTVLEAPTVKDPYGNDVKNWAAATRVSRPGRLEQTDATEVTVDRDTVVSSWRLFLMPSPPLSPYARIEVDGVTYEVVGQPAVQRSPRGPHHIEARLVTVSG